MPVAFDLLYWSEFSSHVNINAVLYYALTVYFMYLCVNFVFSFRIYTVLYSRNAITIDYYKLNTIFRLEMRSPLFYHDICSFRAMTCRPYSEF